MLDCLLDLWLPCQHFHLQLTDSICFVICWRLFVAPSSLSFHHKMYCREYLCFFSDYLSFCSLTFRFETYAVYCWEEHFHLEMTLYGEISLHKHKQPWRINSLKSWRQINHNILEDKLQTASASLPSLSSILRTQTQQQVCFCTALYDDNQLGLNFFLSSLSWLNQTNLVSEKLLWKSLLI